MAAKDDKSKSRPRRNPLTPYAQAAEDQTAAGLEDRIEEERARLMRALSLLDGALLALEAAEEDGRGATDGPHCPTLIEMARELVNTSVNELDSVNLTQIARKNEVRERSMPYGEISVERLLMVGKKLSH